jgi:small subunit ribosomal protein S20
MPNTISAGKRVRKTARRTEVNKARKSQIRSAIRQVEEAIASGNKDAAKAALKAAEPQIRKGVSKGVIHRNTGSRKISRLNAGLKRLGS